MGNSPILLSGIVCREEAIVHAVSNLLQAAGDDLGEPLLVEHLVRQFIGADEDPGDAKVGESVYGTCPSQSQHWMEMRPETIVISQELQAVDGHFSVDIVDVSQKRNTFGAWNWGFG